MSAEFDLIRRYFTRPTPTAALGIGDDAALLSLSGEKMLAVSTDMLVSGTHFFSDTNPFDLGHKALAVNLSDLAAMGATPRWATLALSLPEQNADWLDQFSRGFFALAERHGVELVGGDTTRGSLTLSVTILGEIPPALALRRDGAQPGDDVWVSGFPGEAALGLACLQNRIELPTHLRENCLAALHRPTPRVVLGLALRGRAHSAIDISDGLCADLGHILERSGCGAEIQRDTLPMREPLRQFFEKNATPAQRNLIQNSQLAGGDDYELCFTAPVGQREALREVSETLDLTLTRIGALVAGSACRIYTQDGAIFHPERMGYDHFQT